MGEELMRFLLGRGRLDQAQAEQSTVDLPSLENEDLEDLAEYIEDHGPLPGVTLPGGAPHHHHHGYHHHGHCECHEE